VAAVIKMRSFIVAVLIAFLQAMLFFAILTSVEIIFNFSIEELPLVITIVFWISAIFLIIQLTKMILRRLIIMYSSIRQTFIMVAIIYISSFIILEYTTMFHRTLEIILVIVALTGLFRYFYK